MLDRRILRLTPKRIFCPLCGNWHDWEGKTLQVYSKYDPYEYECNGVTLKFWVDDNCIHIQSSDLCDKVNTYIDDELYLDDIECDLSDPIFYFSIPISTEEIVCSGECDYCDSCNLPNIGDERDDDDDEFELNLEFKFEFASRYFDKYAQSNRDERKKIEEETKREQGLERQREEEAKREQELAKQREEEAKREQELAKQREEEAKREQELVKQCEEEAKREQELVKPHETKKTTKNKEDTTMANNLFNMNMEFGPNKDENIASTLMGVAVKNGDSWRIYDKKKKVITDVGDMQLGNLPIFILPTTKLAEGDLIKDAGEYYFVSNVQTGSTQTLCAKTGEMKTVIPIKNVLGFSCYSKVIALSDSLNIGDDFDVEKLAIMSAMCGQSGENNGQMNQLLPLMLFKDKLGGDDDTMKLVLMSSMMTSGEEGGQMNQLLPLMFLKNGDNGNDDTMKLVLMSSMMGGNMGGSNNLLMSYLMLDIFMGKKEDKVPKKTDEGTVE